MDGREGRDAFARAGRRDGRRAVQHARHLPTGSARRRRAARRPGRHGGQVPGAGGARRVLLDGVVVRRSRPARRRVPVLAAPAERRDLSRAWARVPRLRAAAARVRVPDGRADAPGERAVPPRRALRRSARRRRVTRVAGVDGTKGGWVAVELEDGRFVRDRLLAIDTTLEELADADVLAIDIPIGFGQREADRAARKFLAGSASTVFTTPSQAILAAPFGPGLGVSAQAHALGPRVIH